MNISGGMNGWLEWGRWIQWKWKTARINHLRHRHKRWRHSLTHTVAKRWKQLCGAKPPSPPPPTHWMHSSKTHNFGWQVNFPPNRCLQLTFLPESEAITEFTQLWTVCACKFSYAKTDGPSIQSSTWLYAEYGWNIEQRPHTIDIFVFFFIHLALLIFLSFHFAFHAGSAMFRSSSFS